MTPVHWVWIASAAGALLFFLAGFFMASARRASRAAADRDADSPAGPTDRSSSSEMTIREAEVRDLRQRLTEAEAERDEALAHGREADAEKEQALAEAHEAARALAEAEHRTPDRDRALEQARIEANEFAANLENLRHRHADLESDVSVLRTEKERLHVELDEAQRRLARREEELREARARIEAQAAAPVTPPAMNLPLNATMRDGGPAVHAIAGLQERLALAEEERSRVLEEVIELHNQIDPLRLRNEQLEKAYMDLSTRLRATQRERDEARSAAADHRFPPQATPSLSSTLPGLGQGGMQAALRRSEAMRLEIQRRMEKMELTLSTSQAEVGELHVELARLQHQLEAANREAAILRARTQRGGASNP